MSPPRQRRSQPRPRSARRPISSLLFAVGCLAVLGVTFALGMAAGRRWPNGLPLPGFRGAPAATAAARTERDPKRPEARGLDKGKARAEAPPVLTFYHELTAPMATPPPTRRSAAKPDRAEAKPAETAKPVARPDAARPAATAAAADTSLQDIEGTPPVAAAPAKGDPKFTVQVGAFKLRGQAEALRARLAERGQEATVSEIEASGVTQYRVRVGTFATREAAQEAAARLGSERRLSTYVTTR